MTTPAPETTPTPVATSLVGQVVSGRYRIQKLLGEGGMGAVYLAEHTHMRKRVALKLLHAEMSNDEEVLARFRREAEAAARVEHPNVAAATDFGQTENGAFFLVLEYVEGTSLRDALNAGAMGTRRALHIARQIAFALERAHAAGIVHRDLKPENVMLVQKGEDPDFVKVLDFGIAKLEHSSAQRDASQPLTRLGTILGTPEYMAPEQALGETVGPGADFYAIGVMLYEMLTGKHPFDAHDRMAVLSMHIVAPVPPMTDRNPAVDVPPPVEELVRSLLEKDAKLRFSSARAFIDGIDAAAARSGMELPHHLSSRSLGRESSPDLNRSPAPQSSVAPQSRAWSATDALAKTDYGLPAAPLAPDEAPPARAVTIATLLAPVQKLPRAVQLAIAAGVPVVVLVIVLVIVLARRDAGMTDTAPGGVAGGSDKRGTTVRAIRATPAAIAAASARGVAALETLATEFPEDTNVHRELVLALAAAGKSSDMFRAARTLAKIDTEAVDAKVLDAIAAAAQRPETMEEALALLEGPLGPRGIDALYDLSTNKSAPVAVQRRAAKSLSRSDVRATAAPATAVILDLKAAKRCEDKRDVLERAKDSGDARVLPALKAMKSPRGCGFMGMRDCHPCLRKDDTLDDAIKAVEARASK